MASALDRDPAEGLGKLTWGDWCSDCQKALAEAGRPAGSRDRVALPISGDNPKAKEIVAQIIDRFGFDTVDAGTIAESWRQQPGSPVYCTNPTKEELQKWLKNVNRSSLATKREKGMKAHFAVEDRDPRTGTLNSYHVGDLQSQLHELVDIKATRIRSPHPIWTGVGVTQLGVPGALIELSAVVVARD